MPTLRDMFRTDSAPADPTTYTPADTAPSGAHDLREHASTSFDLPVASEVSIGLATLTGLTGQIALMLKAGTSLVETLDALVEQADDERVHDVLDTVRREISGGLTLASALSTHPRVFDSFYVSTVRVGEASGTLPQVFVRLEEHLQKRLDIRNSLITSLIYPAIVTMLSVGAVVFIMTWVLPRFIVIFERNRVELPAPTRFLMGLSGFLVDYWPWLIAAALLGPAVLYYYLSRQRAVGLFDNFALQMPVVGNLVRTLQTSFLFRTLGTQLASGVPLLESLQVAGDSCKNARFKSLIANVVTGVTQGEEMSACFRRSPLIDPAIKQMLSTGEQSGTLAPILLTISDHLDRKADKQLKRLTAILEPLLLIGMGVMIGFIAIATLFPLFKLTSAVRGG